MSSLIVELYGTRIGVLRGDWRSFDFLPDPAGVTRFGLGSTVLSLSIPLLLRSNRAGANLRRNFFAELLPEGRMRNQLARNVGVSEYDTIELLRHYGRDVAGALQIWDPDLPGEPKKPHFEPLDEAGVAHLLARASEEPLGNKPFEGKTSLAGVQDKIVLARSASGAWSRVFDGAPSTHILKPISAQYPTMIFDEEFGARICKKLGLANFDTWVQRFNGTPALVVERYDRAAADSSHSRIHQEDGSQILGAQRDEKYQKFGGKVSLRRLAQVLARAGGEELLEQLFKYLIVAVAIGNLDMHSKNISVIHPANGACSLAPAYDMVPQRHFPNDGEMALAVNGKYHHAAITAFDLEAEGASWGLSAAPSLVAATLEQLYAVVKNEPPLSQAYSGLVAEILAYTGNLLAGKAAG